MKKNNEILTKRDRIQRNSIDYFDETLNNPKQKKNPPLKKLTRENSDYFQNSLKNVVTYDKVV